MTIPYPYTSGTSHIGHGRIYVNGDIFARYYRAQGFNVLFPMAFHITGTPVLAISSAIERGETEAIKRMEEYVSIHTKNQEKAQKIVKSFKNPSNIVKYFSGTIKEDFRSIGFSIDWRRDFTTGDKTYNKFIEWQFNHLYEKGYIEKGNYPILFCPNCANAVGEDDIQGGDELDLDIKEFICIKFPFLDGFLVASTLRPETLFGVTNIWINPKELYIKSIVDNEIWYISKKAGELLRNQAKKVQIQEQFQGEKLIGKSVNNIFNIGKILILPGHFVDVSTATGVVYSVPAHAPYDYIALEDLKKDKKEVDYYHLDFNEIQRIKPIKIIDINGLNGIPAQRFCKNYDIKTQHDIEKLEQATSEIYKLEFYNGILNENCEGFAGLNVPDAVKKVKEVLFENKMIDRIYYHVSKDLKCRCGENVIISILEDQYFLNYNAEKWKEKAFKCLNQMEIIPNKYRLNFEKAFEWLDKRPCARRRGLGTKLPFDKEWIIESLSDSTIYMCFYTINHKIKKYNIKPEQLIPELFDFIFLNKGSIKIISTKSRISEQLLHDLQNEFNYWYPVDHRHTAIMHISNHLSFFIFHHAGIFPEKSWPKRISLIEPVIIEGEKMGKSKGNIMSLAEIQRKYSSDLFRFFISHAADLGVKLNWREKRIFSAKKHLNNFYQFIQEIIENEERLPFKYDEISSKYSKATLSKILETFKRSEQALSRLNLRNYLQFGFYDIFNLLHNFKRFHNNENEYNMIVEYVIPLWLERLNPTVPHLTEELWANFGGDVLLSGKVWTAINGAFIDKESEKEFDYIESIIEDIMKIKKVLKTKKIDKIYLYICPKWKYIVNDLIIRLNGEFKQIIDAIEDLNIRVEKKQLFHYIKNQIKNRIWDHYNIKINEEVVLREYKSYIINKIGIQIIINSKYDPQNKSFKANPLKPAIFMT
ncbi:MAG: leucine--tRNA ligase [Candidatus Lokiarchaeota archaeon]